MNKYPEYVKIDNKKYKINTNFKVALECNKISMDERIGENERILAIIYKLFGKEGLYDKENRYTLFEYAVKFLRCGNLDDNNEKSDNYDMDFIEDYDYIKASFRSDYNINLDEEDMHFWEFYNLLGGLSNSDFGNCCILNRVRNLRNFDLKTIKDPKEREKIRKAKESVALKKKTKKPLTQEQQKNVDEFLKLAGIDRK